MLSTRRRFVALPLLLATALALGACGSDEPDDGGNGDRGAPTGPGVGTPPGELPSPASFVEVRGSDVGVSRSFACALTMERKIVCWGETHYQHALQLNALGKTAVEIKVPSPPKMLSINGDVGCALLDDGSVSCWGSSARGNTGAGQIGAPSEPGASVSIAGFPGKVDFLQLGRSNSDEACGISAGRIFCWDPIREGTVRERAGGITDAVAMGIHYDTTCVVRANGKVYCWGANDYGQLGVPIGPGTTTPPLTTTPTEVPDVSDVTALAVDREHVCALSRGNVVCWGGRWYAPLTAAERLEPIPKVTVVGLANTTKLRKNRDGRESCAIADGGAYCFDASDLRDGKAPVALAIDEPGATEIAATDRTRCGVFADNRVKCWGPASMALGDGSFLYHPTPTFVPGVTGGAKLFADLDGACILDSNGAASCWGGATEAQDGRVQRWPALDGATSLTRHPQGARCAVIDGSIRCAQKASDPAPTPYTTLTNVVEVALGPSRFQQRPSGCARLTDGTMSCWENDAPPVVVAGLMGVKKILMTSGERTCVQQDGVRCWSKIPGADDASQATVGPAELAAATDMRGFGAALCGLLPAGVVCDGPDPLKGAIAGTAGASLLTVGAGHACSVVGGRVYCWGQGNAGQLGSGNFGVSKVAFPVANAAAPVALEAGNGFTCGLQQDGRVQCWGSNASGIVSPRATAQARPNQVRNIL